MNVSYVLSLADGSHRQIRAGDAGAVSIVEMLARAMKLRKGDSASGDSLLVLSGQGKETFSAEDGSIVCRFPPPENRDELVSRAMEASLAIAHAAQQHGGVLVHGGLAEYKGNGLILAAPGGTGKSTACSRLPRPWRSLSDDAALIVRDPQGNCFAHPWPTWSLFYNNGPRGKWDTPTGTPLKALYFLFQAAEDALEKLVPTQAAAMLIESVEQANRVFDRRLHPIEIKKNHLQQFSIVCAMTERLPAYRLCLSLTGKFWKLMEGSINPDGSLGTVPAACGKSWAKHHTFSGGRPYVDSTVQVKIESKQAAPSGVVFSGNSMHPTLKEPDYLEIRSYDGAKPRRGDVVYFRSPRTGIMVVHRVMAVRPEGLLTKGDNNPHRDPDIVSANNLTGRVVAARSSERERRVRGGAAGMLEHYYARMSRKAAMAAHRLCRFFFRSGSLMGILRSLARNRLKFKFVLFGKIPLGHMKTLANNQCVGRYIHGTWHIDYPWRLLVDPEKIAAAAEKYETAKTRWQQAQRHATSGF